MKRKIISLIVSADLLLTLLPTFAFAEDYTEWSSWSTEEPGWALGREVESRDRTIAYNMVTYIHPVYLSASPISPSMQILRSSISLEQNASP